VRLVVKLRQVPAATGGLLLEDSLAAGLAQGFYLGDGVLAVGLGDTGVADEHRALQFVTAQHPKGLVNGQVSDPVAILARFSSSAIWNKRGNVS
jgi:hypothetical protein